VPLNEIDQQRNVGGIAFENKNDFVLLQVADALKFESYRYATDIKYGMQSKRWKFDVIESTILAAHVFDKQSIVRLIEEERW
jgi:hypothetical protein